MNKILILFAVLDSHVRATWSKLIDFYIHLAADLIYIVHKYFSNVVSFLLLQLLLQRLYFFIFHLVIFFQFCHLFLEKFVFCFLFMKSRSNRNIDVAKGWSWTNFNKFSNSERGRCIVDLYLNVNFKYIWWTVNNYDQ